MHMPKSERFVVYYFRHATQRANELPSRLSFIAARLNRLLFFFLLALSFSP